MKKITKEVWQMEDGQGLLERKGPDAFYVPLATVNEKTLAELGEAIQDALREQRVRRNVLGPYPQAVSMADQTNETVRRG